MAVAMMSSLSQRNGLVAKVQKQTGVKAVARTRTVTKAISDVNLIVGGAFYTASRPTAWTLPVSSVGASSSCPCNKPLFAVLQVAPSAP